MKKYEKTRQYDSSKSSSNDEMEWLKYQRIQKSTLKNAIDLKGNSHK
jgi:hypothetical protein